MSRGRNRKTGERYPSGEIKLGRDDVRSLAIWNRIKHDGERFAQDPKLRTRWGELFFHNVITETQAEAADRWADMLARYDGLNGYRRSTAPMPLERTDKGRGDEPDPKEVKAFLKRFEAAHEALVDCGKLVEMVVTNLCRGEVINEVHYRPLQSGLTALVKFYGLDRIRKVG